MDGSAPYGYQWSAPENQDGAGLSHTPSGPPLLDDSESHILQDFFDNPNNVDTSFMGASQDRLPPDQPFYGSHTIHWMNNPPFDFSNASASAGNVASQGSMGPSFQSFTGPETMAQMHQSGQGADLWAARLLQSSIMPSSRMNGPHAEYEGSFADQQSAPRPQAYGLEPQQAYAPAPQEYGSPSKRSKTVERAKNPRANAESTRMYPDNSGQEPNKARSGRAGKANTARRQSGTSNKPQVLGFGSDTNFMQDKYEPPVRGNPQAKFAERVVDTHYKHFFREAEKDYVAGRGSPPPAFAPLKQTPSAGNVSSSEDEEREPTKKRRRAHRGGDEDREEGAAVQAKARSKKRNSKAAGPASPSGKTPVDEGSGSSTGKILRENLTEEQKRNNHIQSEQKRRNLIKQGFEDMNRIVPELRAGGFSKSNMLIEAAKFMGTVKAGNDELRALLESRENG